MKLNTHLEKQNSVKNIHFHRELFNTGRVKRLGNGREEIIELNRLVLFGNEVCRDCKISAFSANARSN